MSPQPLVSILVNCYNGEKYLSEALNSILAQTYSNWEVVFWDNQSTDRSAEIFNSYGDKRFFYYYAPEHTILYEARNNAIKYAKGELVAFLDVDDWWLEEKLESQVGLFADDAVGIVAGDYWEFNELTQQKQQFTVALPPSDKIIQSLLRGNFIGMFTIVVRKTALVEAEPAFDTNFHIIGDFDMLIRVLQTWKLGWVHHPIGVYRIHGNNESKLKKRLQIEEEKSWIRKIENTPVVSSTASFRHFVSIVRYKDAMQTLSEHKRLAAIKKSLLITDSLLKIRCMGKILYLIITKRY